MNRTEKEIEKKVEDGKFRPSSDIKAGVTITYLTSEEIEQFLKDRNKRDGIKVNE